MNISPTTMTTPLPTPAPADTHTCLFGASPRGTNGGAPFAPAIHDLAEAITGHTGGAASVSWWPYRRHSRKYWAFDITGRHSDLSLTFLEAGKTVVPFKTDDGSISEVADGIDAYWLFKALESLLLPSAPAAVG